MKLVELNPVHTDKTQADLIEKKIKEAFKKYFYYPLLRIIAEPKNKLVKNSLDDLSYAIQTGKIYYENGKFKGKFNANTSKELKRLGATWEKDSFSLPLDKVPLDVKSYISVSMTKFNQKIEEINEHLSSNIADKMTENLDLGINFDKSIFKMEKEFQDNVKKVSVAPKLSYDEQLAIAREWKDNLNLYIVNFTQEQTQSLRKLVSDNVYQGNRREHLTDTIVQSYGRSANKAKFWARQETNLMMAKFQEVRYRSAGVTEYKWGCVKAPHQPSPDPKTYKPHMVRYWHAQNEGKIFSWSQPPVVDNQGNRMNPHENYNCRCFAIPVSRLFTK